MPRIPSLKPKVKGGRWVLDFRVHGRRYLETIGPATSAIKAVARQRAAEVMLLIANGDYPPRHEPPVDTFRQFAAEYLDVHAAKLKSAPRQRAIVARLCRTFGHRRLQELSRLDVERYQTHRKAQARPATVNQELAVLKAIYYKAMAWGKAESNPVRGVRFLKPNNERVKFLSDAQAERLEAACHTHLRPIVVFARHTGMREGEIVDLTWADVDLRLGYVRVGEPKNGEGREVALNATARAVLRSLPRGIGRTAVFLKPSGEPASRDWIYRQFRGACAAAGLDDFRFHDLRHDCASRLVMRGRTLEEVRRVLGHKTLVMTARYAHFSQAHLHDVVASLDTKVESETETPSVVDDPDVARESTQVVDSESAEGGTRTRTGFRSGGF